MITFYFLSLHSFSDLRFRCRIPVSPAHIGNGVMSLITRENQTVTNFMKLHQNSKLQKYTYSACLGRALYGDIQSTWFIEWMEINRIFGAQKFLMHNMSTSNNSTAILEYYRRKGLVDILPWTLPAVMSRGKSWCHSQSTLLADCQYRLQIWSRYIAVMDLDELIFPRHPEDLTWSDMIQRTGCSGHVSSYSGRQHFFSLQYAGNKNRASNMLTTGIRVRSASVLSHPKRTKYIVDTRWVSFSQLAMHIHYAQQNDTETCVMPTDVGGCHHYRNSYADLPQFEPQYGLVLDNITDKYSNILKQRIRSVIKAVF